MKANIIAALGKRSPRDYSLQDILEHLPDIERLDLVAFLNRIQDKMSGPGLSALTQRELQGLWQWFQRAREWII